MRTRVWGWAITIVLVAGTVPVRAGLVISQVYGGGGNSRATKNDFIELLNASSVTINLAGDSVQYASSTGSTWQVTTLSRTLEPGQYYLIQEAQVQEERRTWPAPDVMGTIDMSATAGKVALVNRTTVLIGSAPLDSGILDLVGYGVGTNFFEGGGPAPTLSNTTLQRLDGGLTDTNNNNLDFVSGSPVPRNSVSPFNPPMTSVPEPSAFSLSASGMLALLGFTLLRRKLISISAASY